MKSTIVILAALAATALSAIPASAQRRGAASVAASEISALQAVAARESGRRAYSPASAVKFTAKQNVFLKSALGVDFTYRNATVTLPLFRGLSPTGANVYYIVTDASDFAVARAMGLNYAPKLAHAAGTAGAQNVTLRNGVMRFAGDVDFSPEYEVTPGAAPTYFPPASYRPGAVGDANWSSMAVLPSGTVLNVQMVRNDSGAHDRLKSIDIARRTVTMSLLDGMHDGKQYYYHLVTDVSADLPAVLEKGVFTPKLAMVPGFAKSRPSDKSALLGFSPVLNGRTDEGSGEDQGFSTSLRNGGIDPINIFPIAPTNADAAKTNNYSPLWDAHVSMWTDASVRGGKVRRIDSLAQLASLVRSGQVTSAAINPPGPSNSYVAGLRSTKVIINCPVIAQPDLPPR